MVEGALRLSSVLVLAYSPQTLDFAGMFNKEPSIRVS